MSESTVSGRTTPPPIRAFGIMPRPGQPGAPFFDDINVTEFLRHWNIKCEDFGLSDAQKCARLPDYCTPKTKDVVELFEGYLNNDWDKLQDELKALFWQHDKQKNTPASLNQLIRDAPGMDLNVYILKYTAITDALIKGNEMSPMQRCKRFLDGLSDRLHDKAFNFCTIRDWKLSAHDTGTTDPDFGELKKFILGKAQSAKKKVVYDKERATEGYEDLNSPSALLIRSNTSTSSAPATSPAPKPVTPDPITELTKQFSQLALLIQANMQGNRPPVAPSSHTASTPTSAPAPVTRAFGDRPQRCIYCDSTDHFKRFECSELQEAIRTQRVRINDEGRVVSMATGEELPLMFGKGGMKRFINLSQPLPATPVAVNNITFDDDNYGSLGSSGSVQITTLDFEKGTRTDEFIDADVYEKHKRNDLEQNRRVRTRIDDPLHPHAGSEVEMPDDETISVHPFRRSACLQQNLNPDNRTATPDCTATYQPPNSVQSSSS